MNAMKIAAAVAIAGLIPGIALAQNALSQNSLRLTDVNVVQQPQPAHYQPDATDYDLADRGKTFDIVCTVGNDGHMADCTAEPNGMFDQNFVRIGVDNARGFVIGAQARDGTSTAGRRLSLTCKFHRADADGAGDKDLDGTTVAVNDRP
jgi:hypothetical protein